MSSSESEEMVCQQCGDRGFTNAFVYCVKCLDVALHRYCLAVIPKTFDEFVRWVCHDCEVEEQNSSATHKHGNIQFQARDPTASEHIKGFSRVGTKKNDVLTVDTEEPVYYQHRLGSNSERPHEKCANIISDRSKLVSDFTPSAEPTKNKATVQRDHRCFSHQPRESDPEPSATEHPVLSCNRSLKSPKEKKIVGSSEANLEGRRHRTFSAKQYKENKQLDLENQSSNTSTLERDTNHNENSESAVSNFCKEFPIDSSISSMVGSSTSAEPVITPIWRGSFSIWNEKDDVLDGFVAHLSSRACQKVYEEACQFQPVLHLEKLPRPYVWPKSFETSEPSAENIALYFFPSEIRYERAFDHLVDEMMHNELAMRAVLQNAELLVFTSTQLPLQYWRFQDKYYLWGVFRGKQHLRLRPQSCGRESRYKPRMHADFWNDTEGKVAEKMKSFGSQSPLSPLSNCGSYGSGSC
ncbi:uncharacterized protein LOC105159407 isoform X1 [Sesamum indicum]|uniref:Uncharacterized protein LOC105159407 isoform X1 n=1 Tax=Sesamum indicum TaxID=4182 RepID=A0A6I9SVN7_SESIN|nr:uncharacterized protein LOC105159407 isoform X1 [Sesamum indicum]